MNEHVLIPRQDTEILVEAALCCLKETESPRLLDVHWSLMHSFKPPSGEAGGGRRGCGYFGGGARGGKVQRRASRRGRSGRAFAERPVCRHRFLRKQVENREKYDILISNPPYIPTAQIEELMEEVRFHDPRQALDGKEDGLYFYREITKKAGAYLKDGGWLLYEIGCDQGEAVKRLLEKAGFIGTEIKKDLAGLDRVVCGQKPPLL